MGYGMKIGHYHLLFVLIINRSQRIISKSIEMESTRRLDVVGITVKMVIARSTLKYAVLKLNVGHMVDKIKRSLRDRKHMNNILI